MIYIHELKALNPKSAEIESVPIIREIKQKTRLPVSEEHMLSDFARFMVKDSDIKSMEKAAELIPLAMQEILDFSKASQNAEQINLKRFHTGLQEIDEHLKVNVEFAKMIFSWQFPAMGEIAELVNKTRSLKTKEDKVRFNSEISTIFKTVLRNKQFNLLFWDMVHEAQIQRAKEMMQAVEEGTLFHIEVDEFTKKTPFSEIRKRLPQEELAMFDSIAAKALEIKRGVDTAYDINTRMIGFAVQLYSYMKWLGGI